jgi:hypothetical protein
MDHFPAQLEPLAFPIDKLKHDEANPRQHDDKNLGAIKASLKRWGWRNVIVARKADKTIIAGNGRIEAARSLGWTHAPVVFVADDVTEATAFAIADNRAGELAAWNLGNLTAQLEGLDDVALGDLGFTADDFDDLLDVRDNWLRFDTPLKLKPGIDLAKLPQNDYGLQLVQVGDTINSPALRKLVTGDGQAADESVVVRASSADHPPGD